jgi:hypothetical protein
MLDESLPLTVPEFLEWGNARKSEHFTYMKSYCLYSNLKAGSYPAMLVRTSLNDGLLADDLRGAFWWCPDESEISSTMRSTNTGTWRRHPDRWSRHP